MSKADYRDYVACGKCGEFKEVDHVDVYEDRIVYVASCEKCKCSTEMAMSL